MRIQKLKDGYSLLSFSFTVSNRSLRLTKEGAFFIVLVIGIGFGAINTGINLLYLILAMCLSFIIVSGVLSEITLRRLTVSRTLPKDIFAEQPFPVQVEIKNSKKWFPTYSIWVEENLDAVNNKTAAPSSIDATLSLSKGNVNKNIPQMYYYHVKVGESKKKNVLWMLPKRGMFNTKGIKISTKYPFGFFIKTALINKPEERVVYPAIKNIEDVSELLASLGESASSVKGEGSDIFGFRGFTHGDSSKMIHWKTSAKVNNLMIKEHFIEESRKIAIIFNNQVDADEQESDPEIFRNKFENGVTQAASLADHFIREGCQVKMVTHCQNIPFGSGFNHLSSILYHLALLEPAQEKTDTPFELQEMSVGVVRLSYAGEYL